MMHGMRSSLRIKVYQEAQSSWPQQIQIIGTGFYKNQNLILLVPQQHFSCVDVKG
jgi:hypothetical protein